MSRGDFNFDGYGDLAVGVPGEASGGSPAEGAVHIIYGSPTGLSATAGPGDQFWTPARIAAEGGQTVSTNSGINLLFGYALASGKFNGDEYSDLAIGVPGEDAGGLDSVGAVQVLYGSPAGLTSAGTQVLRQGQNGLADAGEGFDSFGSVLNWGDFNRDGIGDLAVGVPNESIVAFANAGAGAVHVIYGSAAGLTGENDRLWHQNSDGIPNDAEGNDRFGSALAAGDFNGDGTQDLAVGIPGEGIGIFNGAGAVQILYGSPSEGLTSSNNQFLHQDSEGILDVAETSDRFGRSLAAGRFNGGAHDDLAVGVPNESVGTAFRAGAVNVIYGSSSGLTPSGNQFWTQNSQGVQDVAESEDGFGSALAAGDFNGDNLKDLAIGVPFEDLGNNPNAGAVHVIYGSGAGIHARLFPLNSPDAFREPIFAVFARFLTQRDATGGLNFEEVDDLFGSSLTAWDFGFQPGVADLAIGVPNEDLGDIFDAGAVAVVYGVATPGSDQGAFVNPQHWTQDSEGIEDQAEAGDQFGKAIY